MELEPGTIVPCCPACGTQLDQMVEQQEIIHALERRARLDQLTIGRLRKQASEQDSDAHRKALEVARYWKEQLAPRTRELKGERVDSTVKRLRGDGTGVPYTVEELKRAVDGYAYRPFVVDAKRRHTGRPDQRHVDLALIMRDAKHVDAGLAIYEWDSAMDRRALNDGASPLVAMVCDCGHPRASHLPSRLSPPDMPPEPCCEPSCSCVGFDTIERQAEAWLAERRENGKLTPVTPLAPVAERKRPRRSAPQLRLEGSRA